MLAALLGNLQPEEDQLGGVYGVEDKEDRLLKTLRKEYFERQEREREKQIEEEMQRVKNVANAPAKKIKVPTLSDIEEIGTRPGSAGGATQGDSSDDEIALLFIIAEL